MIAIVDYGVGNLFSLCCSFSYIGEKAVVTNDKKILENADKIILPGVGAFGDAAQKLKDSGLRETVIHEAKNGKPLLGICLGMQLLFDKSYEFGEYEGLGLLKGEIRPIQEVIPSSYKIPQIGWNALDIKRESPILKGIKQGDHVYFVHSYYATKCDDSVIATTDYGYPLTAIVQKDNVYGCQFHPEKSGKVGLEILHAFSAIEEDK